MRQAIVQSFFHSACAVVVFLAFSAETSSARAADVKIEKIEIGFAGKYKLGYWTELTATVSGLETDNPFVEETAPRIAATAPRIKPTAPWIEATVLDGDGVPCTHRTPFHKGRLPFSPTTDVFSLLIKPGRPDTPLIVNVRNSDGILATRTFHPSEFPPPLPLSQELYLTFFINDDDLVQRISQPRDESLRAIIVPLIVPNAATVAEPTTEWWKLPFDPLGYEGVDGIIFNVNSEIAETCLTSPLLRGIFGWAGQGGKLVLSANENAERILGKFKFLPSFGQFNGRTTIKSPAALLRYASPPEREEFGDAFGKKNAEWSVPKLTNVIGKVECADGERANQIPLVIRQPYGFGELTFVALDWNRPPLAGAPGRGYFFDKLFRRTAKRGDKSSDTSVGVVAHTGYDDLSGQLRSALDQYPGVSPTPFWTFALLVAAYLAVIGPLDYYLIHRVFQKMQMAWLTFPLSILLFCGLAYWLTQQNQGSVTRVRQVDLVDLIDVSIPESVSDTTSIVPDRSIMSRTVSWLQIYSPQSETLNLIVENPAATTLIHTENQLYLSGSRLEWSGLPGNSLGGMNVTSGNSTEAATTQGYVLTLDPITQLFPADGSKKQLPHLDAYPIPVASSRSLIAHSDQSDIKPPLINLRRAGEGHLFGTITNQQATPLEECVLFYDHVYYNLGRLEPNQPFTLDESRDPPSIEARLNRRRLQGNKVVASPYDPFDTDVRRILETILFHEAAGGREYTQLKNRYLHSLDLSGHLDLGRAILVGRSNTPAIELRRDDQPLAQPDDERMTLVRFVFPVSQKKEQ